MEADFAALEINLFAVALHHALFQIDLASRTKRADGNTRLRIEFDQTVASGHVDHAIVASSIAPVRDAAAGKLPRRVGGALPFTKTVCPDQLAGFGVECDHRAPR